MYLTRGTPSQILANTAVNVAVDVRAAFGRTESIKRTIRNRKKGFVSKDEPFLQAYIRGEQRVDTYRWQALPHRIHDSGKLADNFILMFATEDGLRRLALIAKTWFTYGTDLRHHSKVVPATLCHSHTARLHSLP